MPIATRFDVFTVIKDASNENRKDNGLRKLAVHLEKIWHDDPLGTITAGKISQLRDHYQSQYTRSIVGKVVDVQVPKVAFNTLPVSKLTRIAANIVTQEDYDNAILRNGLGRDDVRSIRARTFIRELVERKVGVSGELNDEQTTLGTSKPSTSGDIAIRIANRIFKDAQEVPEINEDEEQAEEIENVAIEMLEQAQELEGAGEDLEGAGEDSESDVTGEAECEPDMEGQTQMLTGNRCPGCGSDAGEGDTCQSCGYAQTEQSATDYLREMAPFKENVELEGDLSTPSGLELATASKKAFISENEMMNKWASKNNYEIPKEAVAPPGWEGTVKEMKGHEEIENPFALAWWMEGKGYKPEKKD